jgi:dihydropyrimidinase
MLDLAIVGATAVLPDATRRADIGIRDGKIASIASVGQLEPATKTIDATGMLLLPGAVDAHTHLDAEMFGATTADDFESGTIAAAAGGVTSVIDYAFQTPGGSLGDAISKWEEKARDRATIDYSFHVAILDPSTSAIAEIPKIVERGVTSFKIFMMRGFEERARDFMRAFRAASEVGALLTIHAEDEHLIGYCTERLLAAGNRGVAYFASSRPPLSEAAAVLRALKMTEATAAPAYFVHLSSKNAIDEIRRARATGNGRAVMAETRPIYLYLTQERYLEPRGEKYVGYPPLREQADVEAIWEALADGTVDVVATDHCSWLLHSEGVVKRRITLERMVELVASNPAKIFGIYPRKGAIATGSDADLVVFDPNGKVVVRATEMHSRADYDPFEGFEVTGWPRITISRGETIVNARRPTAAAGRGRFLPRASFSPDWRR